MQVSFFECFLINLPVKFVECDHLQFVTGCMSDNFAIQIFPFIIPHHAVKQNLKKEIMIDCRLLFPIRQMDGKQIVNNFVVRFRNDKRVKQLYLASRIPTKKQGIAVIEKSEIRRWCFETLK